jgi:hypothetical protein
MKYAGFGVHWWMGFNFAKGQISPFSVGSCCGPFILRCLAPQRCHVIYMSSDRMILKINHQDVESKTMHLGMGWTHIYVPLGIKLAISFNWSSKTDFMLVAVLITLG